MNPSRVVIAGGSGFIGRALAQAFSSRGCHVVVLTRTPRPRPDRTTEIAWDGVQVGPWAAALDGADAIINLTGKPINCRHTAENLRAILASRVDSVTALATALAAATRPPRVWVQASAVGYYGDTGAVACDEAAPAGDDTLARICREWEGSFAAAVLPSTQKVTLRIGVVLGRDGGALPLLSKLTRCFLGGAAGNGRQYVSWIHLDDLVAMFVAAVEDQRLSGPFNAVSPLPVTNRELMSQLRQTFHRPWSPPVPAPALKLGAWLMGTESSLALISQRCLPKRFLEHGFHLRFPELPGALRDLTQAPPPPENCPVAS